MDTEDHTIAQVVDPNISPFSRLATWLQLPDYQSSSLDPQGGTGFVLLLQKWVRSHIGHSVDLQDLFLGGPPWQDHRSADYNLELMRYPEDFLDLPDAQVVYDLMAGYRSSPTCRLFPVIDPSLFNDTMKLAYDSSSSPLRGRESARACVWAFLASVSIWQHDSTSLAIDGQHTVLQAVRLLPQVLREETIDGLQVLVMLVCFSPTIQSCSEHQLP